MTHPKDFPASMDRLCKVLSVVVTLLFAGVIAVQVSVWNDVPKYGPVLTITALLFAYGLSYALRPTGYRLTDTELQVCRPFAPVRVARSEVARIDRVEQRELRGTIRLFGVGGLFGYYGRFANRTLGSMTWYATRRDTGLLLRTTGGKKILITPDDPDALLREWERAVVRSVL